MSSLRIPLSKYAHDNEAVGVKDAGDFFAHCGYRMPAQKPRLTL
jgi:hypothetical protein